MTEQGYTPTTGELAHAIGDWAYRVGHPDNENRPEMLADDGETMLNRWLAEHDRQVAERAWDECSEELTNFFESGPKGHWENGVPRAGMRTWVAEPRPVNPYRKEATGV